MAFTQTDVETLEAAIATGAKVVRMDGREFEYQTTASMLTALAKIKAAVVSLDADANNKPKRPRVYRVRHSGGY